MKLEDRSTITIIRAIESHAEALADLGERTFRETFAGENRSEDIELHVSRIFSAEKQRMEILDPARRIEMAWSGNEAIGFLHLLKGTPDPSVTGPKPIELLRLYVVSRFKGRGLGPALMQRSIELARKEGFQTLWLGVWERNFRAQAFYAKSGFTRVGSHIFTLGTDDQIDFILARRL